ncbi:MAG: hypothetical protein ACO32I_04395 [Candidatus Limnocylindrus sp.]
MNIRELLRTKLAELDPALDTADGSYADRVVITPVANALSSDLITVDTRQFLLQKYAEAFPTMPVARGDAISDILISAAEVFFSAYRQQLSLLQNAQSISKVDLLSDADADALAANWLVGRAVGAPATGSVTVVVDRLTAISMDAASTTFFTATGLAFVPVGSVYISSNQLQSGQIATSRYSFDVEVAALADGPTGNILAGEILSVTGIGNVVSVTNKQAFTGGVSGDTTEGLLTTKLPRAISERSLVTARGISARLGTSYQAITGVQVIGLDDPEMERDAVTAESFADVAFTGLARVIGKTVQLSCISVADAAQVTDGMRVVLYSRAAGVTRRATFTITAIVSQSASPLTREADINVWARLDEKPEGGYYYVAVLSRARALLDGRQVNNDVHLGGRTDIYLRPRDEKMVEFSSAIAPDMRTLLSGVGVLSVSGPAVTLGAQGAPDVNFWESVLQIGATTYDVLYGERLPDGNIRVYLEGEDYPVYSPGASWTIIRDMVADISGGKLAIYPRTSAAQGLIVSGSIGAQFLDASASLNVAQLATANIRQGDTINLLSDSTNFTIDRVVGARVYVVGGVRRTIAPTPAIIYRTVQSMPTPVGIIGSIVVRGESLPYGRALGMHIESLGSEGPAKIEQSGVVAPSLYYALRALYAEAGIDCGNILLSHTLNAYEIVGVRVQDEVVDSADGVDTLTTPASLRYSRSHTAPPFGTTVVLAADSSAQVTGDTLYRARPHELLLWNELFAPGTRNIFICPSTSLRGDTQNAPDHTIGEGDVLRIHVGPNAGSYLIAGVVYMEIESSGDYPFTRSRPIAGVVLPATAGQHVTMRNTVGAVHKVACIKIHGEFPVNEHEHIEQSIVVQPAPEAATVEYFIASNKVRPLSLGAVRNMFVGGNFAVTVGRPTDTEGLLAISPHNAILSGDAPTKVPSTYKVTAVDFSIHAPARGTAQIISEDASCVAVAPTPSMVPLDVMLRGLKSSTPAEPYRIPSFSRGTWGSTEIVASPIFSSLYADMRFGLPRDRVHSISDAYIYSHDRVSAQDIQDHGRAVTLEIPTRALSGPVNLAIHDEIYLSSTPDIIVEDIAVYIAPVEFTGYGLVDDTVGFELGDAVGSFATGAFLRQRYARSLSWRNAAGVTLSAVLSRYPYFAFFTNTAPVDHFTIGVDTLVNVQGASVTVRVLTQPETRYTAPNFARPSDRPLLNLATIGPEDTDIQVLQPIEGGQGTTLPPIGSLLRLQHRGEVLTRNVVGVVGNIIKIDAPITTRCAKVLAYGLCYVNTETGDIYLGSGRDYVISGSGVQLPAATSYDTLLYAGGATRPLYASDVNKTQIILWGVSENYMTLAPTDSAPLNPPDDVFAPIRTHLGTARVASVSSTTQVSPTLGTSYITSQTIRCAQTPWRETEIDARASCISGDLLRCFFQLVDDTVDVPDVAGDVHALTTVQAFEQIPTTYNLAATSLTHPNRHFVLEQRGSVGRPQGELFRYAEVEGVDVLVGFDINNPYRVLTPFVSNEFDITALRLSQSPSGRTVPVTNAVGDGYQLSTPSRRDSRSVREVVHVVLPHARKDVLDESVAVRATYTPVVTQTQTLLSSPDERAVCSDAVARRMAPGYIGVHLQYEGGPTELVMQGRIRALLQNAISQGAALSASDIVALAINIGAQRVTTPIDMYICVEDMSRVRHRRAIVSTIDATQLLHMDCTYRITSLEAAPADGTMIMGAAIRAVRETFIGAQIGNGGA